MEDHNDPHDDLEPIEDIAPIEEEEEARPRRRRRTSSRDTSDSKPQQMMAFIKEDLWGMTKRYFMEPISGVQALANNSSSAAPLQAATLMLVGTLVFTLGTYIFMGEATEFMEIGDWVSGPVAMALCFMLVMTGISFLIKKATSNGGDFKDEMTTGALFAFPLIVTVILIVVMKETIENASAPAEIIGESIFLVVALLYIFLMMVNTLQQSLKASKVSDLVSWYASPSGVCLGIYATYKIMETINS